MDLQYKYLGFPKKSLSKHTTLRVFGNYQTRETNKDSVCINSRQIQFQVALIDYRSINNNDWWRDGQRLDWFGACQNNLWSANKLCIMSFQHLVNNLVQPSREMSKHFSTADWFFWGKAINFQIVKPSLYWKIRMWELSELIMEPQPTYCPKMVLCQEI